MDKKRKAIQVVAAVLQNGYLAGYAQGKLYTGRLKRVCVPGLNCYSCPGAFGACPVGALQSAMTGRELFSFYVLGLIALFGLVLGRAVCAFLCPFGLIQELLYKIPGKKLPDYPLFQKLTKIKYLILALFVFGIPLYLNLSGSLSFPAFCKYICPAGALEAGIPMVSMNPPLQDAVGLLFFWKVGLMILILGWAVFRYRAFCRILCPLGAIYSFFNKISLLQIHVDPNDCTRCGACVKACPMKAENTASPECIRCGLCMKQCPANAMQWRFGKKALVYSPAEKPLAPQKQNK